MRNVGGGSAARRREISTIATAAEVVSNSTRIMRRTKIVATLGPASSSPEIIRRLIEAGMDVARLNFSHGSREDHAQVIATLRAISQELDKPVTILQDLQGPKIRVGQLPAGETRLTPDAMVS